MTAQSAYDVHVVPPSPRKRPTVPRPAPQPPLSAASGSSTTRWRPTASVQPAFAAASDHRASGSSQPADNRVHPTALTTLRGTRPPVWRDQKDDAFATWALRFAVVTWLSAAYLTVEAAGTAWTRVICCTAGVAAAPRTAAAVRVCPETAAAPLRLPDGLLVTVVASTSRPALGALSGPGRRAPT